MISTDVLRHIYYMIVAVSMNSLKYLVNFLTIRHTVYTYQKLDLTGTGAHLWSKVSWFSTFLFVLLCLCIQMSLLFALYAYILFFPQYTDLPSHSPHHTLKNCLVWHAYYRQDSAPSACSQWIFLCCILVLHHGITVTVSVALAKVVIRSYLQLEKKTRKI